MPKQRHHESQQQQQQASSPEEKNSDEPAAKKLASEPPRKMLNFSIESIIKQAEQPEAQRELASSPVDSSNSSTPDILGPSSMMSQHGHKKTPNQQASLPTSSAQHLLSGQQNHSSIYLNQAECRLDNKDMWDSFHGLDTEMIITKQGRRMFPPVRVTFSFNCNDQQQQNAMILSHPFNNQHCRTSQQMTTNEKYHVLMDILPYDKKRYRYAYHKSSWQQAGKADPPSPTKLFLHPDGPFTLDQLKRQVISFEKIKLTNNDANKHGYIVLNSMHKYQPRIHLVLWRNNQQANNLANAPISQLEEEAHKTFIFRETIFTAVTAYQNHSITKLKIDSNPFAKGFRDSSRLTDLELESMQDLISADGQCPFSPPRAPPPGFSHFLFAAAAAASQSHQQQQHHHHHYQPPPAAPVGGPPIHLGGSVLPAGLQVGPPQQVSTASHLAAMNCFGNGQTNQQPARSSSANDGTKEQQKTCASHPSEQPGDLLSLVDQQQQQQHLPSSMAAMSSANLRFLPQNYHNQHQQQHYQPLEHFLLQQQQHFAAAMAAAAAAHHHQQQQQQQQQQLQKSNRSPSDGSPTPQVVAEISQTSPIGAAKCAARSEMLFASNQQSAQENSNQVSQQQAAAAAAAALSFLAGPLGGASSSLPNPIQAGQANPNISTNLTTTPSSTASSNHFVTHPYQLLMQQQQMAALQSMQSCLAAAAAAQQQRPAATGAEAKHRD